MSVITDDTVQVPIDLIGGLYTLSDAMNNPPGASPNCQDSEFLPGVPGTVRTRPGLLNINTFAGNPTINYARTFKDMQQNNRGLYFDSLQNLWEEYPQGTFNIRGTMYQSKYVKSDTAFGREFLAFSDGKFGTDAPRQWDGTNLDRISQDGPGQAPAVVDGLNGLTLVAGPNGAKQYASQNIDSVVNNGATDSGFGIATLGMATPASLIPANGFYKGPYPFNIVVAGVTNAGYDGTFGCIAVSINCSYLDYYLAGGLAASGSGTVTSCLAQFTTTAPHGLAVGQSVVVAGVGVAGYNGTWSVYSVIDATNFTADIGVSGLAADGGGTVSPPGHISAGIHQVSVLFITRQGYWTRPSPPVQWTAAGNKAVVASNIPIGPANVIARVLCFTVLNGVNFYYIPQNFVTGPGVIPPTCSIINDNTTTSAIFDFTDAALLSNVFSNVDNLFDDLTLGEVAGFLQYESRIFAWGERNKLNNLLNLSFDGGSVSTLPTGWTSPAAGGSLDANYATVPGLASYRITGDGATAKVGTIQQSAAKDYLGIPIIEPATAYSVRFRLMKNVLGVLHPLLTSGTFHINLSSVSGGGIQGTDAAVAFNDANLTSTFHEYILPLVTSATFPTTVPADLLLSVYADGTPGPSGGYFDVDDIEIFPTLQPYNLGIVRASNAADPETFAGTTGFLAVNVNDDQRVTCLYLIRDMLRITKEHGLFTSTADPANEPANWNVSLVSAVAGSATINSAGPKYGEMGKEWAALVCREGVFIDYGQLVPEKLNQEVQPSNGVSTFNFDAINWAVAHTIWVAVDMTKRRMLIGLPLGEVSQPNVIACLDFKAPKLGDPQVLAQTPLVAMSTFTNKQVALSGGRKWCPWNIAAMCGGLIERSDGTAHLFLGNAAGNGKLYDLLKSQTTDDGATIPLFFQTSYMPDDDRKNVAYRFQGGYVLAKYLRIFAQGSGSIKITMIGTGGVQQLVLPLIALANPAGQDIEIPFDFRSERISARIEATGVGSWVSVQKLELFLQEDPVAALRGSN